ncbi:hypothetical protein Mal48_34370 [Thalassoglobus polymorphus]|uniref:Uncharacterized protein n=1 Tax=Thalassoglobus polymorphus TaxID=2527994 RepID=A0A517QRC1_9PLAN|nr:hypothetical protein Mal48_34370 [Thalassoglobus polymorphus]
MASETARLEKEGRDQSWNCLGIAPNEHGRSTSEYTRTLFWGDDLLDILISSALLASDDEILKDVQCRLEFVEERES